MQPRVLALGLQKVDLRNKGVFRQFRLQIRHNVRWNRTINFFFFFYALTHLDPGFCSSSAKNYTSWFSVDVERKPRAWGVLMLTRLNLGSEIVLQ